jgi:hypothetical protein
LKGTEVAQVNRTDEERNAKEVHDAQQRSARSSVLVGICLSGVDRLQATRTLPPGISPPVRRFLPYRRRGQDDRRRGLLRSLCGLEFDLGECGTRSTTFERLGKASARPFTFQIPGLSGANEPRRNRMGGLFEIRYVRSESPPVCPSICAQREPCSGRESHEHYKHTSDNRDLHHGGRRYRATCQRD